MEDNIGKKTILNGRIFDSKELSGLKLPDKGVIYEVIRIIRGVPLFFEDHTLRLKKSLAAIQMTLETSEKKLTEQIRELLDANGLIDCNIKLVVFKEGLTQNILAYISKSYYPSGEEIARGVSVSLMQHERKNPNVKMINLKYKQESSKKIEQSRVFEVLLVNNEEQITEGSKSNAFFVKDSIIYTAPGEYVLKGVTREYIIQTCRDLGYKVEEKLIGVNELKEMDGLFISGTSIKVLPVSQVDEIKFNSPGNKVINAVRKGFDKLIENYVRKNK